VTTRDRHRSGSPAAGLDDLGELRRVYGVGLLGPAADATGLSGRPVDRRHAAFRYAAAAPGFAAAGAIGTAFECIAAGCFAAALYSAATSAARAADFG
jgi:hypothetical protein